MMKTALLFSALLSVIGGVQAGPPREQLNVMVEQLQKTPTDDALREKIVRSAQELRPPPAIPEEANRFFVRGNVFQKQAKDSSDFLVAISAYQDALRIAPWWGDAYYNLSAAQESAQQFNEAINSVKLYLASLDASSPEAREAQNRIYAIEAKREMASRQAAKDNASSAARRFSGDWYNSRYSLRIDSGPTDSACSTSKVLSRVPGISHAIESCSITGDKLRLNVTSSQAGTRTAWATCEFHFEGNDGDLVGTVVSGGTAADTSSVVKGMLCLGLWKQK